MDENSLVATAGKLVKTYGRDALGEVVLRLVDARLSGEAEREAWWFAVLNAVTDALKATAEARKRRTG